MTTPHKPGCPANGGYGNGVEPCICGADQTLDALRLSVVSLAEKLAAAQEATKAMQFERDEQRMNCVLAERKAEEAARDSTRLDWMIEHGTDEGGGSGFEFRVYIPHDSECLRDAIDAAIAAKGGGNG